MNQLRKISESDREVIYDQSQSLKDFPNCKNVKKLNNHRHQYRLKVGNYRVFFDFDGLVKIVKIEEVKKRDENTY